MTCRISNLGSKLISNFSYFPIMYLTGSNKGENLKKDLVFSELFDESTILTLNLLLSILFFIKLIENL